MTGGEVGGRTFDDLVRSPGFCILPWSHLSMSVDGVWARCCVDATAYHEDYYRQEKEPEFLLTGDSLGCLPNSRYAGSNPDQVRDLTSAFNSPAMRRTRLAMLAGEEVQACDYCFDRERSGGESNRQQMNAYLPQRIDVAQLLAATAPDGTVDAFPPYLDLRFGNSCNLACIMCGFPVSSRWGTEQRVSWTTANIDPYRDDEALWEALSRNATSLRRVYFAGGEPFMQPLHFRALEMFVQTGAAARIELFYNSNLTLVPDGIFDLFEHFESVSIGASCDGIGPTFEKIRRGARWEDFVRNVDLFRRHVKVLLQVATQVDNIGRLGEILRFAAERDIEVDLRNIVQHPASLSVRNLSLTQRRCHRDQLLDLARSCADTGQATEAEHLRKIVTFLAVGDDQAAE